MSPNVHTRDNHDAIFNNAVIQPVRKSSEERSTSLTVDDGELLWICLYRFQGGGHSCKELFAQVRLASFLP